MKVAITTAGTRGDLQPYIALGQALQAAGHDVLIVSAKNEEDFVKSHGLDFYPLNVDIRKLMEGGEVKKMSKGDNPVKFIFSHLKGSKALKQLMVATQQEIWNSCQHADTIIFHPGMPIGFFIAKELGRMSVLATPFPAVATKDYPSILFYGRYKPGRIFNLFTHFIFEKLFWSLSKPAIKEFWNTKIRSAINLSTSPLKQQIMSGMPVLNGYSEHVFQRPKEWSKNIHVTGSWLISKEPDFIPPGGLVHFIEAGKPPVYIGFGSMNDVRSFNATLEIILRAVEMTGQRAVVALGEIDYSCGRPATPDVYIVNSVPHAWLFPHMALVVHHGGAGTTAAGLTAGKPAVIIPHNADQPAWGQRVYELGAGARPIKRTGLTAAKLAAAILSALKPEVVAMAAQLGVKLRNENGVLTAVKIIEDAWRDKVAAAV